jgi:hypothetical protein
MLSGTFNFGFALKNQNSRYVVESNDRVEERHLQDVCTLDQEMFFSKSIYLDVFGDPHLLTDAEFSTIALAFINTYNNVTNCGISDSTYRRLEKTLGLNAKYENWGTRWFSLKYTFRNVCRGCNQTAALFQYSHLRLKDLCPCQGPQMVDFELQFPLRISRLFETNQLLHVQKVRSVAEEIQLVPCLAFETFTTSNVLIYLDACSIQQSDLDTLSYAFLEAYNRLNQHNVDICDPYFRRIDSSRTILTLAVGKTLNSQCAEGDYVKVQLNVLARCRGCNPSNITLFDLDDTSNTNSDVYFTSQNDGASSSFTTENRLLFQNMKQQNDIGANDRDKYINGNYINSRILQQDGDCKCSLDPLYRSITPNEVTKGMNDVLPFLSNGSSWKVIKILERELIDCSPTLDTFEVTIDMAINVDADDSSTPTDIASKLTDSMIQSYNSLTDRYCDPYFRKLVEVENLVVTNLVPIRRNRILQKKGQSLSVSASVKGKCRACKGNTILHVCILSTNPYFYP